MKFLGMMLIFCHHMSSHNVMHQNYLHTKGFESSEQTDLSPLLKTHI